MKNLYPRNAWRVAGISVTALLLLTFYLYQHAVLHLIGKWNELESGEYGHGYLVLLISVYLIFYNRQKLMTRTPCPEYKALLAVVMSSMLWLVAALVDVEMLQTVGLLLLVLSIVWAVLGTQVTQILVFPVMYIGFALPVWFPLLPLLQELTADVVFWIMRALEIPAMREENIIVLPYGKLSVEETCSGLRYLMAALTLGALYAYMNYATFRARLVIVLVSAGAAVLANIMRVFIVVYYAYKTDMQHPLVNDHIALGWYIFGGLVIVLLIIETQLHRMRVSKLNHTTAAVVHKPISCNKTKSQLKVFVLVVALSISAAPLMVFWVNNQPQSGHYPVQIMLPEKAGSWLSVKVDEDGWLPKYRGAIAHKVAYKNNSNHIMQLYLGVYPVQKQGEELVHYLNQISDDEIWRIRYQSAKIYHVNGQRVLEQLLVKNDGTQRLVWYWYRVAGKNTVNEYQAKALQVKGVLTGIRQAAVVAIATSLKGEPEAVRKILGQFVEQITPSIETAIDGKN